MYRDLSPNNPKQPRVGRPRRGTEATRNDTLIASATQVFLRDGYGGSSIDKVASEAGVSTRTIYERFKNKADLLGAVITRLVERDMAAILDTKELDRLEPRQALTAIAQTITGRFALPDSAALLRILAMEAQRFPELAAKMRTNGKARLDHAVAEYLRGQVQLGTLRLADPDRAASLFLQMICGEMKECMLFGTEADLAQLDFAAHINMVVDLFLNGTIIRDQASTLLDAPL
jgi:TetR/AcrR family transcriptional regulator, mexJK operon transcriptional repressor